MKTIDLVEKDAMKLVKYYYNIKRDEFETYQLLDGMARNLEINLKVNNLKIRWIERFLVDARTFLRDIT